MTATPDPTALDRFVYSQQPGYDETASRAAFAGAIPLKTIVIDRYNPRAAAIPAELVKLWPDEIYPGDLILDDRGKKAGSTSSDYRTSSRITRTAGRAASRRRACSTPTAPNKAATAVPAKAKIFGMLFEIDRNEFTILLP